MPVRMQSIAVKHNIEVAHRLYELPGKCEQIHGHSMWVTMELFGDVNSKGILAGIEYGDLKKLFRGYLDEEYDHRLLLNIADPFSRPLFQLQKDALGQFTLDDIENRQTFLPGLQSTPGDPTTENLSKWIAEEMAKKINNPDLYRVEVTVWETATNMAKTVFGKEH